MPFRAPSFRKSFPEWRFNGPLANSDDEQVFDDLPKFIFRKMRFHIVYNPGFHDGVGMIFGV